MVVLPFRIVEKTTKQTLDGDEVIYKAECPKLQQGKYIALSDIQNLGHTFSTIEDVRTFLVERTQHAVAKMISDAIAMSNQHFGEQPLLEPAKTANDLLANNEEDSIRVILPDGNIARVKTN